MKPAILLAAFAAFAAFATVFPSDPSGVEVIDRDFLHIFHEGVEYDLYITLFNSEGRATVKIEEFRNGEWETVCTWNPLNLGDEYMVFKPVTVLNTYDQMGRLQVSWTDMVEFHEGMITFYLLYDYVTGEREEGWVD